SLPPSDLSISGCVSSISRLPPAPSGRRPVGEQNHSRVKSPHVVQLHADRSAIAEDMEVSPAPDERVQVDLVLVDQAHLGAGGGPPLPPPGLHGPPPPSSFTFGPESSRPPSTTAAFPWRSPERLSAPPPFPIVLTMPPPRPARPAQYPASPS